MVSQATKPVDVRQLVLPPTEVAINMDGKTWRYCRVLDTKDFWDRYSPYGSTRPGTVSHTTFLDGLLHEISEGEHQYYQVTNPAGFSQIMAMVNAGLPADCLRKWDQDYPPPRIDTSITCHAQGQLAWSAYARPDCWMWQPDPVIRQHDIVISDQALLEMLLSDLANRPHLEYQVVNPPPQ